MEENEDIWEENYNLYSEISEEELMEDFIEEIKFRIIKIKKRNIFKTHAYNNREVRKDDKK